ncbi:MAG TPA: polyprenyl synthetase family protein [Candidatus Korarchaeota archaeon]|nr:polyprenyl synthetase family protein [Candidatus Korarchaeota archaeon]
MINLKRELEPYIEKAEIALSEVLSGYSDSIFYKPLIEALKGGKRIRPTILLLVNEMSGGGGNPEPAAAAIELMHNLSLIHDDLIDKDILRRGKPSFQRRFGEEMAMLMADYVMSVAVDVCSRYQDKRVLLTLSWTAIKMSEGEMEEFLVRKRGERISIESYMDILYKKTAAIFEAAAKMGAIIAGATEELIEMMGEYGRNIGLAYQVKDDLLDWGRPGEISSLVEEKNPRKALNSLVHELVNKAIESLKPFPDSKAKELLQKIARYIEKRKF